MFVREWLRKEKVLVVEVSRGMKPGQTFRFYGEADEAPGLNPGDIIFVLKEKRHPVFTRRGDDLLMEYTLPLVNALTGFQFPINSAPE